MRRYERHVKAADEETSDEQQVAAVSERLPYRVAGRHRRHVGVLLPPTALQGRGEHGGRSVTVSHRPGEGLPDAPDEVLDRYGQGEDFGRPTAPLVYRGGEQA